MLVMSCITTFWLLDKLIENIRKNPIVIYQSDIATQITNIAFPTITYCTAPDPKVLEKRDAILHLFSRNRSELSDEE